MTQRERLVTAILALGKMLSEIPGILKLPTDKQFEIVAECLMKIGVILPPCKIEDEVYHIVKRCGEWQIISCKVKTITYHGGEWWDINDSVLGGTVFLAREEAEATLGRRKEVNTTS